MGVWREIVRYLARYIDPEQPVLDVACDAGYFIQHVEAAERWATDIRDVRDAARRHPLLPGGRSRARRGPADGSLRHGVHEQLPRAPGQRRRRDASSSGSRAALLRPGGRLIVVQPNIRLVGGSYWDFIDHRVALTERSLVEAGDLVGLRTVGVVSRFLPYTTKGRLPSDPALVRLYFAVPLAWRVLGRQSCTSGSAP